VSAYVEDGKPTADYDAYTLNYLIMSDSRTMPAPVPFTWNWVDKDSVSKDAGAMSVNRGAFRDFLAAKLAEKLADLAWKPSCGFSINLIQAVATISFSQDSTAQKFQTSGSGATLLTYGYSSSSYADDTFVPNWGNWSVDYTSSCDVSVAGTEITVVATVNARCHLNIDGGVTEGNWASYQITTAYTIGVAADGTLTVTQNDPQVADKSEKPDPSWYSELISLGTIDDCVGTIQGYLKPTLEGFGTGLSDDIAAMLNGSSGWTFPGGKTFAFTDAAFSDFQDLVTDLLYVTPQLA
jgi:hypothetical protein